jgi:hypothetical protein
MALPYRLYTCWKSDFFTKQFDSSIDPEVIFRCLGLSDFVNIFGRTDRSMSP